MYRRFVLAAVAVCVLSALTLAQSPDVPRPPFTMQDAERGLALAKTAWQLRGEIPDMLADGGGFKIAGNLYHVGVLNGDTFLLTSPQGHILIGGGFSQSTGLVEKHIEQLGFKVADIKVVLVNHNHPDQAGGAPYFREKTGAKIMIGFADIAGLERAGAGRGGQGPGQGPGQGRGAPGREGQGAPGREGQAAAGRGGAPGGGFAVQPDPPFGAFPVNTLPPMPPAVGDPVVKVDRALFDGDVIRVGPLAVTAYSNPLHTLGSMTFAFTVREGGRDLRVAQVCCWEIGSDIGRNQNLSDATFEKLREMHRKLAPLDIYLECGSYAWGGMISQPSGTFSERFARLKTEPKWFINRDVFTGIAAAREVDFQRNMAKFEEGNPKLR